MAPLVLALACSKCSDSGEWCTESRRKKGGRKEKGREEGFFPLSSCPQHLFYFSPAFLCTVPLSERLELGAFLAPADSAVAVRKNDSKAINVLR